MSILPFTLSSINGLYCSPRIYKFILDKVFELSGNTYVLVQLRFKLVGNRVVWK